MVGSTSNGNYELFNPNNNNMELYDVFQSDDGSFGFKMPQKTKKQLAMEAYDKRTIDSYKVLTKEIKDDYLYMFTKGITEKVSNCASYWSPMGYFYQNGRYLEAITGDHIGRSTGKGIGYRETRCVQAVFRENKVEIHQCDSYYGAGNPIPNHISNSRKLRRLSWDWLLENGYVTKTFEQSAGASYNHNVVRYYDIADDALKEVIKILLPESNWSNIYGYTKLFGYRNFCVKEGKMSYFYQNREVIMKMGKGIKKLVKVYNVAEMNDEQVKQTVDRVLALEMKYEMQVVEGEDIDKYYLWSSYCDEYDTGSLANSCMRYEECIENDFFEVYKDHAKMIICKNTETGKIVGRAILWDNVYVRDSSSRDLESGMRINVMDRVYSSERVYVKFFDWASKNLYYRKRYQSYDNEYSFVPPSRKNGDEINIYMEMDIDLREYESLPYMDTFAWCDGCVVRNEEGFGRYTARDTDGSLYYEDEYDDDDY